MSIVIAQQIKIMMRYHHSHLGNQLLKGQTNPKTQNADREKTFILTLYRWAVIRRIITEESMEASKSWKQLGARAPLSQYLVYHNSKPALTA